MCSKFLPWKDLKYWVFRALEQPLWLLYIGNRGKRSTMIGSDRILQGEILATLISEARGINFSWYKLTVFTKAVWANNFWEKYPTVLFFKKCYHFWEKANFRKKNIKKIQKIISVPEVIIISKFFLLWQFRKLVQCRVSWRINIVSTVSKILNKIIYINLISDLSNIT